MNVALIYMNEDFLAFGLRNISSVLKEAGHNTKLILMNSKEKTYSKEILEETRKLITNSDIIGISCFSRASEKAIQILDYFRPLGKIAIWGGVHATLNPEECVKYADIVCRGEGEKFMVELVEKVEKGENWKDIPNSAYKENGRIIIRNLRPLISNLDELPILDLSHDDEFHLKGKKLIQIFNLFNGAEPITFNGTRGCAFHCTYCSNSKLKELFSDKGRYVRKLSISKLIEHLESLKQRFPKAKCFNFFDEDFCSRKLKEIEQFSEEYSMRIGFPFECMVSPMHISEEKISLLVKAGLWRINMGVESGSERTKKEVYNRPMPNEAVMHAAQIINKYPQVVPYYFFIIGNPYESHDDLIATARFIKNLPCPYYLRVYNLVFFPGTLLYESAIMDGMIKGMQDSGFELDFLGGLDFKKHTWKNKHIYLNGILFLMAGKITHHRLGLIPRYWLEFLLRPGVIDFNEKNTLLIRTFILFKIYYLKLRSFGAYLVKKLLNDPTSIYNLKKYLKCKMKNIK